jgi:hypothetical protein
MKINVPHLTFALGFLACAFQSIDHAAAQAVPTGTREIPSRSLPVPDTVSPQMQTLIARPLSPIPS